MIKTLVLLFFAAFVQNMAFTWVSRSRNSGDPNYHRWAALSSNTIWLATQLLIMSQVWKAFSTNNWYSLIPLGVVYVVATTEGSVLMMRILLKKESGARRVGAPKEEERKC